MTNEEQAVYQPGEMRRGAASHNIRQPLSIWCKHGALKFLHIDTEASAALGGSEGRRVKTRRLTNCSKPINDKLDIKVEKMKRRGLHDPVGRKPADAEPMMMKVMYTTLELDVRRCSDGTEKAADIKHITIRWSGNCVLNHKEWGTRTRSASSSTIMAKPLALSRRAHDEIRHATLRSC